MAVIVLCLQDLCLHLINNNVAMLGCKEKTCETELRLCYWRRQEERIVKACAILTVCDTVLTTYNWLLSEPMVIAAMGD